MAQPSKKSTDAEDKTTAIVQGWVTSTASAENRAIYRSSARDFEIWYQREVDPAAHAS